jgi:hypothetical protein
MVSRVSALQVRPLSLPEEWVLLSLKESGKTRDPGCAVVGCAAAELGELALRQKLLVRSRKFNTFGFHGYRPYPAEIQLLDTSRTGLPWADELLADLELRRASGQGRLPLKPWLRQRRRQAFTLHRNALAERGALRHTPGARFVPFRIFKPERHYPDPAVRNALITEMRAVGSGQSRLDERALFLSDLVGSSELYKDLGVTLKMPHRLDRARGTGTVAYVPEDLRDTSAVLALYVPERSRHQD